MLRPSIEPMIAEVSWLLPLWAQRLCVFWSEDEILKPAYMRISRDYRWMAVYICPAFARKKRGPAIETLYHEIHHAFNATLMNLADSMIDSLAPKKDQFELNKLWRARFTAELEAVNQDARFCFGK